MGRKRYTPEQIISMLREAGVLQIQGSKMADICRKLGISSQTYCVWFWDALQCIVRFSPQDTGFMADTP